MDLAFAATCGPRACVAPSSTARCVVSPQSVLPARRQFAGAKVAAAPSTLHRRGPSLAYTTVTSTAAAAPVGTLISKTEVPAFIPRDDMADQFVRWAFIESNDNTISKFGMPFKVEEIFRKDDGRLWGANLHFLRNGETCTTLYIGFDDDVVLRHEWLGMNDLGFPVPEGDSTEVLGKHFEIRKVCDRKVDDPLRAAIREMCKSIATIINTYYAFGSVFVDDTT